MSTPKDTLEKAPSSPDRVVYATGVLLDALDFDAEQTYHRGRLARALAYLHGSGTVSGLLVEWDRPLAPGDEANFPNGRQEQVRVAPGLALDRLGRLIEVPRAACLRLGRWFDGKRAAGELCILPNVTVGALTFPHAVIADVFVSFAACARGKTPAFAAGPFDALDAVQPSRWRDFYDLELIVRDAVDAPLPVNPWAEVSALGDPTARRNKVHELIFASWREGTDAWDEHGPTRRPEHVVGQNPTAVFLARLTIPLTADDPPQRDTTQDVVVQNDVRQFVYTAGALVSWLGP
jgi:hypothetical protein